MKKSKRIVALVMCFYAVIIFCGCSAHNNDAARCLLRLHVRANSNSDADQSVKLAVRDGIVRLLERELDGVETFDEAYAIVGGLTDALTAEAERVLREEGFTYGARVRVNNEFFPTRAYGEAVVEAGYYDALIVELGSGKGDNWWCVIYPPLCFVRSTAGDGFAYKSKIAELWKKYFG